MLADQAVLLISIQIFTQIPHKFICDFYVKFRQIFVSISQNTWCLLSSGERFRTIWLENVEISGLEKSVG